MKAKISAKESQVSFYNGINNQILSKRISEPSESNTERNMDQNPSTLLIHVENHNLSVV